MRKDFYRLLVAFAVIFTFFSGNALSQDASSLKNLSISQIRDSIIFYYETHNDRAIPIADYYSSVSKDKGDIETYYWAKYAKIKYNVKYGDRNACRLDIYNFSKELSDLPSDYGEACYHSLLGHLYYYRSDYSLSIDEMNQALSFLKEENDATKVFRSEINISMARSFYGMLECEDAIKKSASGRENSSDAYMESECNLVDCLSYGYLADKDNFLSAYDKFKQHNEAINISDSLLIEAYHDAFTLGKVDYGHYDSLSVAEPKRLKLHYLIAKLLGDDKQALEFLEAFRADQMHSNSEYYNNDMDILSVEALKEEVHSKFLSRITILCIIFALLVVITAVVVILLIRKKNREILQANQDKTNFVQNMAHDVRTPLNAVVGFSQLLALPADYLTDEERETYAKFVNTNSQLLTILIDDVLSANDPKKRDLSVSIGDCNVNAIGNQSVMTCSHRCKPGVVMSYSSDIPDDKIFRSDPNRVLQVLINFLSNATKNTESGTIVLKASLSEHPGKLTYTVTDTGCGVPEDKREVIFKRFVKLDDKKQGSGLGLNICTQIAAKLGAEIGLDPTYTTGARFYLILPL